ncbi:hypothetical protein ACMGE7_01810 [Macrococcus equi]|uniref:hypothetical protein n=1 Tax=Macrococcus equi TaxID=3395462 RepID=UPI0039BDA75B
MKKVIVSAILLSSLFGGAGVSHAQGDAKPEVKKCYTPGTTGFIAPKKLDTKTIAELKKGTYQYKGIKIGTSYNDIIKRFGKPEKERIENSAYGKMIELKYGKVGLLFLSVDRYANKSTMKLTEAGYDLSKTERFTKTEADKWFGKATEVDKGKDHLVVTYGKVGVEFDVKKKPYTAKSVMMVGDADSIIIDETTMKKNTRPGKFNGKTTPTFTNSDIKAMAAGTFSLKGAKLNMTPAQVNKAIGQVYQENYVTTAKQRSLKQHIADFYEIEFNYIASDCNAPLKLQNMKFDYSFRGLTFDKVESLVGKPNKSVQDKPEVTTVDNKEVKVPTRTNTYGHLTVKGELVKGKYRVLNMEYK